VEGKVSVHNTYVEIKDVSVRSGPTAAKVTGLVRWADDEGHIQPLDMDVKLQLRTCRWTRS